MLVRSLSPDPPLTLRMTEGVPGPHEDQSHTVESVRLSSAAWMDKDNTRLHTQPPKGGRMRWAFHQLKEALMPPQKLSLLAVAARISSSIITEQAMPGLMVHLPRQIGRPAESVRSLSAESSTPK